jgi:radical SAM superfamily enzyme YgiQ (UPF0313 family)
MTSDAPHILLVNPWIHDFAAYDFWSKPLGLLSLASILRIHGLRVAYIDCLDRFHPRSAKVFTAKRHGRGPYLKMEIPKPAGLSDVPRTFSRYGIKPEWFREDLLSVCTPDLIMVTSGMTYWYPGVQETIAHIKSVYPDVPVILGGAYATLCEQHALTTSGADRVVAGPGETAVLALAQEYTGISTSARFDPDNLDTYPRPAFDLQHHITYIPLLTSRGCPFACAYCASHYLNPDLMWRDPLDVVDEIKFWHTVHHVVDFALYDDAFLVNAERHAIPFLDRLIQADLPIRLHTPNAIHIRNLSPTVARLMFAAGFETVRLGLETTMFEARRTLDGKVTAGEFQKGLGYLKTAGFRGDQVGAYLLVGLPGQRFGDIADSIAMVKACGIMPVPAYYSPIPHTDLWPHAVKVSRYDLASDPIYSNNAILPCQKADFAWTTLSKIKTLAGALSSP